MNRPPQGEAVIQREEDRVGGTSAQNPSHKILFKDLKDGEKREIVYSFAIDRWDV